MAAPGIRFINPWERSCCLYPDGTVGVTRYDQPYVITFDPLDPKNLTGHALRKRFDSAEIEYNAEKFTRNFLKRYKDAAYLCHPFFDAEGRYTGMAGQHVMQQAGVDNINQELNELLRRGNEAPANHRLRQAQGLREESQLPNAEGTLLDIRHLTRDQILSLFLDEHLDELKTSPADPAIESIKSTLSSALSMHDEGERHAATCAAAEEIKRCFHKKAQKLRDEDLPDIATMLRAEFLDPERVETLEQDMEAYTRHADAVKAGVRDVVPEVFRRIAEYNGLSVYIGKDFPDEGLSPEGNNTDTGWHLDTQNYLVLSRAGTQGEYVEEFVHYCDEVIGTKTANSGRAADDTTVYKRYSDSDAFKAATEAEMNIPHSVMQELGQSCPADEVNNVSRDSLFAGLVRKLPTRTYHPQKQSAEHLAEVCKMIAEFRQENSIIRHITHKELNDEADFFQAILPLSYPEALEFWKRCEGEVRALEAGETPLYTGSKTMPGEHAFHSISRAIRR